MNQLATGAEREAYILYNMFEGMGPVKARAISETLGSAAAGLVAPEEELLRVPGIGRELATKIIRDRARYSADEEQAKAERLGARIITPVDPDYPTALKNIYDPPLALYVQGTLKPADRHALALVGSRRCTHYGQQCADRFGYGLAKAGFTVVSGLARGIDAAAHRGALKAGGRTFAVLGGALDCLYPPENADLAQEIAEQGAVIAEYPLGREPDRTTFPYRNRVVSGLSMGVLVVESPLKSGSLITADAALEQGRLVFAVPGRVDSPASRGGHALIKAGAKLVEDVNDIVREFEYLIPPPSQNPAAATQASLPFALGDEEQKIVAELVGSELDVDTLARRTGVGVGRLSAVLMGLEMKKIVRMLPGRMVALAIRPESVDS